VQALLALLACVVSFTATLQAQTIQPLVAIHDSELTRVLESQPATGATPSGGGTTGFQWWPTDWHYFVMPESVKEALRSDGTAFTVIGDSNIASGLLLPNGAPKYPIVISLAAEAIQNSAIAQLTNYVAAGGYLVVGASAFTRNPDGTARGDFAFANELGLHLATPTLTNWAVNGTLTKVSNHRLLSHIPDGQLTWRMPAAAEEISWGISPSYNTSTFVYEGMHDIWRVQASDATVIAQGDASPFITVKKFGKGYFIYIAAFQPLIGHGGNAPGMYSYMIFRQAIEWAFEAAKLPVTKLSPWPFEYDAAFISRHDLENFASSIANIEASAQVEASLGVKGDYYLCTGTLREDMSPAYNTNAVVTAMQRAVVLYGATVGPHNGGLKNPRNPGLTELDYDFWHWGPDEALDVTPLGYIDGKSYAMASLEASFQDIESWLPGLMSSSLRPWCAPRFNATRDDSLDLQAQVGVKITGDQKLTPFPHWTFSTRTPGKRYPMLSQPVSDWFVGGAIAQSLEPWRPPNVHNSSTMRAGVDFYYNLGALVNFYSHTLATGEGAAGQLMPEFIAYCANTNAHPRMWSANAVGVYDWWAQRSTAKIAVSQTNNGDLTIMTVGISGASSPRTTVELLVPDLGLITPPQILLNGVSAAASSYRINGRVIKILVGTSVTTVQVSYALVPNAVSDFYQTSQGTTLTVSAPGVLSNDQSGGNASLTAALVSNPAHGTVSLSSSGAFTYTPASGYTGADSFTYRVSNGQTNSLAATVNISVTRPGEFFADDFNRTVAANQISPWTLQSGTWSITNGVLTGVSSLNNYGSAYISGSTWSNYTVQAKVQFDSINALGGGLGGRLNPVTGAHYAAWIYPEGSVGGSSVLKLIKFTGWGAWSGVPMQTVNLPGVGTTAHTLALTFQGDNVTVAYDGVQVISMVDTGYESVAPFTGGGISADVYTYDAPYLMSVDDVSVTAIVQLPVTKDDSYQTPQGTALVVGAPGVLGNDQNGSSVNLSAALVTAPTHGTLSLNANGGFTYTATNNYAGADSFTYQAKSGTTNYGTATVSLYVARPGELFFDDFTRSTSPSSIAPWTRQAGTWSIANGVLMGAGATDSYGNIYFNDNSWSNYTVQARFQFSAANALGAGLGGRLNPTTGAHYSAWVYPEGSAGGSLVLKLIKFTGWANWSGVAMQAVTLPNVGTNWHTLAMTFQDANIAIAYDGIQVINVLDNNYETITPYSTGGISVDMYTYDVPYTFAVDDVSVITTAVTVTPPAITSQPVSITNLAGTTASFSVTASGTAATCQWRFNGTNIAGATSSTYTIASVQATNAGNYTVTVSNSAGSVTSAVATLTVTVPKIYAWSAPVAITTADSALNLSGNIVGAAVFGGTNTFVTLANGTSLLFKSDGSVASATGAGGAALPTYGSFFSSSTTGNANFNYVLNQGAYDNGPHAITLKGLTVGQQYSVQLFALDDRAGVVGARVSNFQDPLDPSNVSATFAMSNKVYVVGTFVATSTNMVIQQNLPTSNNGAINAGNINALVVRAIGGTQAPVIVSQPASRTNLVGAAASFSVVATGNTLRYQWQFNGANIANATNSTYTIASSQAANTGSYAVVVSNLTTSVTSVPATLTVVVAPAITTQPVSRTNVVGTSTSFSVVATGTSLTYQWQFNGVNIAGATASTYTLASVQTNNAGNYTVVITNLAGKVTSAIAKLTVTVPTPPKIGTQPVSQTVTAGQSATFSVAATGTAPLSYQWRFNGTNIANATNSTYTVINAQSANVGGYTVVVSNGTGAVTSSAATLNIKYSLTVTTSTGGTVTLTPSASTYAPGTSVKLVAKAGLFYRFTGWTGDITSTASTLTINMNSNTVVKANFTFSLF